MHDETVFNDPKLWSNTLPRPAADGHKYDRGYAAIYGAADLTGATRLAAAACSRMGAGLVGVVAEGRGDVYRASLPPDIMVARNVPEKANVLLGGPGGIAPEQKEELLAASDRDARVFDAGAIPGENRFGSLDDTCILTPHVGEFERLFGAMDNAEKAARAVTERSGAVIILKSSRTVIVDPTGRTVVNTHGSPYLAKAGTGDVLAGMIAGLVAQGMPPFEASCAAVWMHGEAGRRIGCGLIAGDIADHLPAILDMLL